MKAGKANLLQFIQRAGHLMVPSYQRSYSWGIEQCVQLWEDLLSLARNESIPSHFFGSIVYIEDELHQITVFYLEM